MDEWSKRAKQNKKHAQIVEEGEQKEGKTKGGNRKANVKIFHGQFVFSGVKRIKMTEWLFYL